MRMTLEEQRRHATELFQQGQFAAALQQFSELIQDGETSELWNDWATAQFQCGAQEKAEQGYRRALELDKANTLAAVNLGILLASLGRLPEAIEWLKRALYQLPERERPPV